jgi:hypothetical protein
MKSCPTSYVDVSKKLALQMNQERLGCVLEPFLQGKTLHVGVSNARMGENCPLAKRGKIKVKNDNRYNLSIPIIVCVSKWMWITS